MEFFTADTHFGHERVIEHDQRPHAGALYSTIEEHDAALIDNWNRTVSKNDLVWHLGDFAFRAKRPIEYYLERLNGSIHLVRGNHDDQGKNGAWKHRHLFASAHDAAYIRLHGVKLYLHHYACRVWRSSNRGSFHLFGHSHGNLPDLNRSLDVGVMNWNYRPVSFGVIYNLLITRPFTEHHALPEES